jgi:hypothetical protein
VTVEAVDDFVKRMQSCEQEAKAALAKAADDMKRFYDAHRTPMEFAVGDSVWLDARDITTTRPTKKFDDKWFGPYKVTEKISRNAYRLALPTSLRVHPVFHVSRLRRFEPDTIEGRPRSTQPPPVTLDDGTEEYEVEKVIASRWFRRKLQYLVKWKGWSVSHNTWEPAANVEHATKLVEEFHRHEPTAVRTLPVHLLRAMDMRHAELTSLLLASRRRTLKGG